MDNDYSDFKFCVINFVENWKQNCRMIMKLKLQQTHGLFAVRAEPILGSAEYQLLGNTRHSVVTSLPKPSIKQKTFEQQFIHLSYKSTCKLTYIEAQGPIYL